MYVPFSKNEINKKDREALTRIVIDVTGPGPAVHMVTLKTPQMLGKIVTFTRLAVNSMIVLNNFQISQQKRESHPRYKHMYLTLALRCVLKWAKDQGPGRLAVYSYDQSTAEVFIDSGMKLRRSASSDRATMYRGSIEFKI